MKVPVKYHIMYLACTAVHCPPAAAADRPAHSLARPVVGVHDDQGQAVDKEHMNDMIHTSVLFA